ncbi:MAG: type II toxin-antitoxin system VapC family toxin [Ignisphaera sp.]
MKYFIDSNVFVYAKVNDKKYGKCCGEVIRRIYKREIDAAIDSLILLEVANALRKLGVKDVEDTVLAILSLPISVVDFKKEDVIEAVKDPSLSPYDSLHYIISKRWGAKIVSADSDFKDRVDPCSLGSG